MVQYLMDTIILLNKKPGLTPLACLNTFKEAYPEYKSTTLSYAGRLDPMAEGLLLILVNEENKKRELYQSLEKEYTFSILFGVATDTYDVMGRITQTAKPNLSSVSKALPLLLSKTQKLRVQQYPPFSSKTVQSKPLYWWAREKRLHEITIPSHPITITSLSLQELKEKKGQEVATEAIVNIQKVFGEFRQKEILKDWQEFKTTNANFPFPTATCTITCSSGTYVRSICHELGEALGCGAIATSIKRTRIGTYTLDHALNLP